VSTDPGDVVWEPFGGLFAASVAAARLERQCYAAEPIAAVYRKGRERLVRELGQK
jgi:site-specific DNA-methyltransferase (adenine-specific)